MQSFLTAIGTANPPYSLGQQAAADWMVAHLGLNGGNERILRSIYAQSGIEKRHTAVGDYVSPPEEWTFFPKNLEPFPGTAARMALFRQEALPLSLAAIRDAMPKGLEYGDITHLVTVSCTGMYAPGLDLELVSALGIRHSVARYSIQFMGCYAALTALRLADGVVKGQPSAKVLIVCTELCTLHFQKETTRDAMVSNALFADGAAAFVVEGEPRGGDSLRIVQTTSWVAKAEEADMAWQVGDNGFHMRLSAYVPSIIGGDIVRFLAALAGQHPNGQYSYAFHPGGRRILDECVQALSADEWQVGVAYDVLKRHGNMSSATIGFVLKEMQKQPDRRPLAAVAFGPGITMEGALLSYA